MNAWNWTVFQLMTHAAMNEQDKKNKQETIDFIGNLLNNTAIKLPGMYK